MGLKHQFIAMKMVNALFWEIDIAQLLIASYFIKELVAFVLAKGVQSYGGILVCPTLIFGIRH